MPAPNRRVVIALSIVCTALALTAVFLVGSSLLGAGSSSTEQIASTQNTGAPVSAQSDGSRQMGAVPKDSYTSAGEGVTAPDAASSATEDQLIVRTGAMDIRVDDVDRSVAEMRRISRQAGAEITQLSVQSGSEGGKPVPLDSAGSVSGPSTAYAVLRVPADKLPRVAEELGRLGTVVSESRSSDDVTQQHVDLSARLRNLKAEEARLRTFLTKTNKVSDLLAVERELSRVRGEIESMQAQVDYLERQAARATLTVTLSEPGPVVRPESGDWGILDAITQGIQSAVAVVRAMIAGVIALLPVIILSVVVWLIARALLRRRRVSREKRASEPSTASGEE